jgi:cysteine desulfurase
MQGPDPKYFDYAASAPPFREALDVYSTVSASHYANPSSIHSKGGICREKLREWKGAFCALLGFGDGRLLLTSSGTEANNTLVLGHLNSGAPGKVYLAENVHDSLWFARDLHASRTCTIKNNRKGIVEVGDILSIVREKPSLICLSHGCNETGAIQPLDDIGSICHYHNIPLLIDGVQTAGHIPLNLDDVPFTYYTFSAHKFGAPRGTGGALIRGDAFDPLLRGGSQEWNLRAGTENIAGLAASVKALSLSVEHFERENIRLDALKRMFMALLKDTGIRFLQNSPEHCLAGFLSLSFPGMSAGEIVAGVSLSGYSISTGSACHADKLEPPRAILAIGRRSDEASGTVRITMGRHTTEEAVQGLVGALKEVLSP